jgi:hypothetical protein
MKPTLSFSFLYHKPQLCSYVIHIMTHLHLEFYFWNLNILKLYCEFLKISNTNIWKLWVFFIWGWYVIIFFKIYHQIFYIKRVLNLKFYKTNLGVLKFKSPLLKPKLNLVNKMKIWKILQHSYKSFSTNFLDQYDIKMALHKYVWKFWQFFNHLTWLLARLIMMAPPNVLPCYHNMDARKIKKPLYINNKVGITHLKH